MNALLLCVVYPFALNQHIISIHRLSTVFSLSLSVFLFCFSQLPLLFCSSLFFSLLVISLVSPPLHAVYILLFLVNFSRSFHFNNITLECKLSILALVRLLSAVLCCIPIFGLFSFTYVKQLISSSSPEKYVNYEFRLKRISAECTALAPNGFAQYFNAHMYS